MNRAELEDQLAGMLKKGGVESPQLESRWLLEKRPQATNIADLQNDIERRLSGEPLAYILESRGFHKYEFVVRPGVLIPRPETELVVEVASQFVVEHMEAKILYDFGCGSGCIGLTLIKEFPQLELYAWDQSEVAVSISEENSKRLNVEDRAKFFVNDIGLFDFNPVPTAELIVSNPPYIALGDSRVEKQVFEFEPHEALFSGVTGLELISSWATHAFSQLKSGGLLVMEVGINQRQDVDKILEDIGFKDLKWYRDLSAIERVVSARKVEFYG